MTDSEYDPSKQHMTQDFHVRIEVRNVDEGGTEYAVYSVPMDMTNSWR